MSGQVALFQDKPRGTSLSNTAGSLVIHIVDRHPVFLSPLCTSDVLALSNSHCLLFTEGNTVWIRDGE